MIRGGKPPASPLHSRGNIRFHTSPGQFIQMPAKHLPSIAKVKPIVKRARVWLDLTVNAAAAEHAPSGVGEEVVPGYSAARRHGPSIESSSA